MDNFVRHAEGLEDRLQFVDVLNPTGIDSKLIAGKKKCQEPNRGGS